MAGRGQIEYGAEMARSPNTGVAGSTVSVCGCVFMSEFRRVSGQLTSKRARPTLQMVACTNGERPSSESRRELTGGARTTVGVRSQSASAQLFAREKPQCHNNRLLYDTWCLLTFPRSGSSVVGTLQVRGGDEKYCSIIHNRPVLYSSALS